MLDFVYKLTSRKALAIGVFLFLALLVLLATLVNWRMVFEILAGADRRRLTGAMGFMVLGYLAYAVRWRYLLKPVPRFFQVFHIANAGTMVNVLLPGWPGDPVRVLLLAGNTRSPVFGITSSIVVERWYEQIMRLAAFGGALIFGAGAHATTLTALGSVAYLVFSFLLMVFLLRRRDWVLEKAPPVIARLPRIQEKDARRWLGDLINGLAGISSPSRLLFALIWSLVTWGLFWGFHFLCLAALHPSLPTNQLLAISLGSLALVPPSATTVPGVYQMSMVIPLTLVGYNRDLLTGYSLVMNTAEMIIVLLLGIYGTLSIGLSVHELMDKARNAISPGATHL